MQHQRHARRFAYRLQPRMLESYGFTGVTFSDSDVISSGLVLGHAFQNNWLFVALFIVFVAALAWFVNGKSAKPKGENVHESV